MALLGRFAWNGHIRYAEIEHETAYSILDPFLNNGAIQRDGDMAPLGTLQPLAPAQPQHLFAIGLNYVEHAKESGKPLPNEPLMWFKAPGAIIGHEETIEIAYPAHRTDYEAELAVVMGRTCRGVSEDEALSYVLGFTNGQDISDRDIQKSESQWARAKSLDTYAPLGPFIETELDPNNLRVQSLLNGELKQDGNTGDMIFSVAFIISFLSRDITLHAGDVIMTGTPVGIGPLRDGDRLETRIGDLPPLVNMVKNRDYSGRDNATGGEKA